MKKYTDLDKWFSAMNNRGAKDYLRDDCSGVNDMMNPDLIYAVVGTFIKGTWNMRNAEGAAFQGRTGKGIGGFSKTAGKRKMVKFKL